MAEPQYIVAASDPLGTESFYYRGPGAGMFNRDREWVGSMLLDCAKRMTLAEAEAIAAEKRETIPERTIIVLPWT
jgi:hypothetical protein